MTDAPLPWQVGPTSDIHDATGQLIAESRGYYPATRLHAEFIVRCVNSHADLLETLALIRSRAGGAQMQPEDGAELNALIEIRQWAADAVAKAEQP